MRKLKKSDINIKEWEFEFQQRNKSCILMADLHCRGLFEQLPSQMKLDIEPYDYIFTKSDRGYVKISKKNDVLGKLSEAMADEKYVSYVTGNATEKFREFGNVVDRINLQIESDFKAGLLGQLWQDFSEAYIKMMPWFYIPWYVSEENMLTDRVKAGLERYREKIEKVTNLNEALLLLVFPTKKAFFQQEQEMFFELVDIAERDEFFENNSEFRKKVKKYLDAFAWRPTFFFLPIELLGEVELVGNIKEAIEKNTRHEFEQGKKIQSQNEKTADRLFSIFQDDKQLINDIKWARELGWALTFGVEDAHRTGSLLKPFLGLISEKIGIETSEIQYLTSDEIQGALNGNKMDRGELDMRKTGYVYACLNGITLISSGKEGIALSEWFDGSVASVDTNISEFKGQPASGGMVKGFVRISMTSVDSKLLKEGEILVCSMTSPDYVPAMKRAAAIITDEGGLLCHAAIMSREFGKPCIIGTKVATKVLKDGDLVEVDANKGEIRILKKA